VSDFRRCAHGGFTLLEMVVTLVVLGFLLVALTDGIRFGWQAWTMEGQISSRDSGIEATDHAC
jgi:general secretion pathway protein J